MPFISEWSSSAVEAAGGSQTRRLIVTELAVIERCLDGLLLKELAPGVDAATVQRAIRASLIIPHHVPPMVFR